MTSRLTKVHFVLVPELVCLVNVLEIATRRVALGVEANRFRRTLHEVGFAWFYDLPLAA